MSTGRFSTVGAVGGTGTTITYEDEHDRPCTKADAWKTIVQEGHHFQDTTGNGTQTTYITIDGRTTEYSTYTGEYEMFKPYGKGIFKFNAFDYCAVSWATTDVGGYEFTRSVACHSFRSRHLTHLDPSRRALLL